MRKDKPMSDMALLIDAVKFAAERHRNQRRKDAEASPYINHPLAVTSLLAVEAGIDDLLTLQAAVLHDTMEDTDTTYEELVDHFGAAVADAVRENTDDKSIKDKHERKRLQVVNAPKKSLAAARVKLADKTCNLRDIANTPPSDWTLEKKQNYFDVAKQEADALTVQDEALRTAFEKAFAARPAR